MTECIEKFAGEHRFLSNFWMVPIEYEGIVYPSSEHAYQAAKTLDVEERHKIAVLAHPAHAKKAGLSLALRSDWKQVKRRVMEEILRRKFEQRPLAAKLAATGTAELVEGNTWGDQYWGVCGGAGENHLGRLLMKIRTENFGGDPDEANEMMLTATLPPPLKWAGGKRWLVPRLRELYAPHRHRRLVEPFVGGMSVALGLNPTAALLGDVNPYLINFYAKLQRGLTIAFPMLYDSELYYLYRNYFNARVRGGQRHGAELAGLFYYLNRTCFNGLCRFNKSGEFNVPFGKYTTVNYRRDFFEYAPKLRRWTFARCDFELLDIYSSDFVYLDPPYDTDFTSYSKDGFTWEDQERVAKRFAAHLGPVVASNQATERVLALYRGLGYTVEVVAAPRSISSQGDRVAAAEMLATKNIN